jgi:hypothetical protein
VNRVGDCDRCGRPEPPFTVGVDVEMGTYLLCPYCLNQLRKFLNEAPKFNWNSDGHRPA